MPPDPLYTSENTKFAYQLNWSLTLFWKDNAPADSWFADLREATEKDGVRILEMSHPTPRCTQFFVSTRPETAPHKVPWSVKGRLQYLVRSERPNALQRNFDLRSVGSTTREKAEAYVASQLQHHWKDNAIVRAEYADLQFVDPEVDLGSPRFSAHARFWCNLQLTFVCDWRQHALNLDAGLRVHWMLRNAVAKHGHLLSRLAILPDHLHLVLGIKTSEPPATVALSYLNNLAYVLDMRKVFMPGAFIGTVGEYDLGAIR